MGVQWVFGLVKFSRNRQATPLWQAGITQYASPPSMLSVGDHRELVDVDADAEGANPSFPSIFFSQRRSCLKFKIDLENYSLQ